MNIGKLFFSFIILFALGIAGCSSSNHETAASHHEKSQQGEDKNTQLRQAIEDELLALTNIENQVQKGNFKNAHVAFENIHEIYHTTVFPRIKEKDGKLAEQMHGRFDALEDAINRQDKSATLNMIKVNRKNLEEVADMYDLTIRE